MKTLACVFGLAALAGTIVPPALFLAKALPLEAVKQIMLVSTVVWFAAAPFWMKVE
ncbi:MAG: hypothetical protein ACKOEM_13880 [Planctomycetia bacterium]